jgi:hypothetical protein
MQSLDILVNVWTGSKVSLYQAMMRYTPNIVTCIQLNKNVDYDLKNVYVIADPSRLP